jgi:NADPH:quinone reductase-like Zn-dependent oxidoreductase
VEHLSKNPPSPKFHVIYDAVGLVDPSLFTYSAKYLAPGGIFISTGPLPQAWSDTWNVIRTFGAMIIPSWLGNVNRKYALLFAENKVADMEEIRKLVANGSIKPVVDSVFEFDHALKAYDRILTQRATGKVIIKVDPTAE